MENKQKVIRNRIAAINAVHKFLNDRAPKLREYVKANGYKYKAGTNELFKKDKDAMQAIIGEAPANIHTWISCSLHSGPSLVVKTNYPCSGDLDGKGYHGAAYYECSAWLEPNANAEAMPIHDVEKVLKDAEQIEPLREKIRELESDLRKLTYLCEAR